jgi:hypothetical protein
LNVFEHFFKIEVPGAPNMPKLWVKEKTENNIIINWSEPRTFTHVPCTGYQVIFSKFDLIKE